MAFPKGGRSVCLSSATSRLRTLRLEKGISQNTLLKELGRKSYQKAADISQAENGVYVKPGLRRKLAEYFGVEENYLFDKDGFAL